MSAAETSAALVIPNVNVLPECFSRIFITNASSAFKIAVPCGFRPSINSAFAAATFSIVPRYSR